jgi:hypothetical protein
MFANLFMNAFTDSAATTVTGRLSQIHEFAIGKKIVPL